MYRSSTDAPSSPSIRAESGEIHCYDPGTLESLGTVRVDAADDVRAAIARAKNAQPAWAAASHKTRRKVLRTLLREVIEQTDEIVEALVRDAGKTREHALMGEIWPVCEKLRHTIATAERDLRPETVSTGLLAHKKARIEFLPLGVIGIIAPWNYPFQNVFGPLVPALAAGNAVIVKVSEWVAWSSLPFQALIDDVLSRHGFSPDLVRIVNGFGETGEALVRGGVDQVVFTGCIANGRKVIEASAENAIPVIMELGGKDALIVCADANVEKAVHAAFVGAFITSGQSCLACERILVNEAVYDEFVARSVSAAKALRQGPDALDNPARLDVGAMTSALQIEIVDALVQDAVANGARALVGGRRNPAHDGQFYEPTVLVDVRPDMRIMTEETFGPVLCICRVADDDEAVAIADGTEFGLGSNIFSRDPKRAEALAARIQAGGVCINDFGLTYMAPELPFGGVKASGFGRLNGRLGIRNHTNQKAVITDRFPTGPTKLFPVGDTDYDTVKGTIRTIYSRSLTGRAKGLAELAMASLRKLRS